MIDCAYCERPLICESCGTPYLPPNREHYEALSHLDDAIECPECGSVLVCHWCKSSYGGLIEEGEDDRDGG